VKALSLKSVFFFRVWQESKKNAVRKKGTAQVKKNPPSPQAGRGGNF
jgi:hypothetical protein